jgi:putative thioredoxin
MTDITLSNFQTELIEASCVQPVLLDIWAPWCGPCRTLGPILERVEAAYAGRFKLAKLNADEVPQLAGQLSQMFGVRSIPFCVLFHDGQPVDGFVGAQPEAEIRAFLDRHVPDAADDAAVGEQGADVDAALEEAQTTPEAAQALALQKLAEAVQRAPDHHDSRAEWVSALVKAGDISQARQALNEAPAQIIPHARLTALGHWLSAIEAAPGLPTIDALQAAVVANKRDFDAWFALAQYHFSAAAWPQAMDALLEIILRDKAWRDERARKTYVAILEIMSPPPTPASNPTAPKGADGGRANAPGAKPVLEIAGKISTQPLDPLVDSYRRKLSMALF